MDQNVLVENLSQVNLENCFAALPNTHFLLVFAFLFFLFMFFS